MKILLYILKFLYIPIFLITSIYIIKILAQLNFHNFLYSLGITQEIIYRFFYVISFLFAVIIAMIYAKAFSIFKTKKNIKEELRETGYVMLRLLSGVLCFFVSWIYILKIIFQSKALLEFLNSTINNKEIINDIIFVISVIIPTIIFIFLLSLIKKERK